MVRGSRRRARRISAGMYAARGSGWSWVVRALLLFCIGIGLVGGLCAWWMAIWLLG